MTTVRTHKGKQPHVEWIDLKNNGVFIECAVMKRDDFGNIFFIEIPALDNIDKSRLARILANRNASNFELWDLMSQMALNNGVNALLYFHQLVKVITPSGVVMNPRAGQVGIGRVDTNDPVALATAETHAPVESLPQQAQRKTRVTKRQAPATSLTESVDESADESAE